MKKAAPMRKTVKTMKTKKVSKVARGRFSRAQVLTGRKEKTRSGLTATDLIKNKHGKIVSRKKAAQGARKPWPKAVYQARKALNITGFCLVNGKTAEGKALYAKAKAIIAGQ